MRETRRNDYRRVFHCLVPFQQADWKGHPVGLTEWVALIAGQGNHFHPKVLIGFAASQQQTCFRRPSRRQSSILPIYSWEMPPFFGTMGIGQRTSG